MFKETEIGFKFESETHLCFFGNKNASIDLFKNKYPHYIFKEVKQTHSDILVHTTKDSPLCEGDAQWTNQENIALYIKTADCIPALIINIDTGDILAVHAGWRGVQNKILQKSLNILGWKNIDIFWGPHILQDSFKVQEDVNTLLQQSCLSNNVDIFKKLNNAYYIDLLKIAQSQVSSTQINNQLFATEDTVKNFKFNSYRRDKENSGRNISFIVKKNLI